MAEVLLMEILILTRFTDELTILIAGDLITVASKLFGVNLISHAQIEQVHVRERTLKERANELVLQVISLVKVNRKRFRVFLDVLQQVPTCQELARKILKVYSEVRNFTLTIKFIKSLCRMETLSLKSSKDWKEE